MSYNNDPIKLLNVDVSLIKLISNGEEKATGRMFNIYYGEKQRLAVILPELEAPFGPKKLEEYAQPGQVPKVSLSLAFNGYEEQNARGDVVRQAHAKLKEIANRIADLIVAEPKDYFPKDYAKVSKAQLEERVKSIRDLVYHPEPKDGVVYPDTYRINFKQWTHKKTDPTLAPAELALRKRGFTGMQDYSLILDKDKNPIEVDYDNIDTVIFRGAIVKVISLFDFVFCSPTTKKATINCVWYHGQIRNEPKKTKRNLLDDEDEDMLDPTPAPTPASNSSKVPEEDEDDDDEDESEDDEDKMVA